MTVSLGAKTVLIPVKRYEKIICSTPPNKRCVFMNQYATWQSPPLIMVEQGAPPKTQIPLPQPTKKRTFVYQKFSFLFIQAAGLA